MPCTSTIFLSSFLLKGKTPRLLDNIFPLMEQTPVPAVAYLSVGQALGKPLTTGHSWFMGQDLQTVYNV
jgi:hypothetical protein